MTRDPEMQMRKVHLLSLFFFPPPPSILHIFLMSNNGIKHLGEKQSRNGQVMPPGIFYVASCAAGIVS